MASPTRPKSAGYRRPPGVRPRNGQPFRATYRQETPRITPGEFAGNLDGKRPYMRWQAPASQIGRQWRLEEHGHDNGHPLRAAIEPKNPQPYSRAFRIANVEVKRPPSRPASSRVTSSSYH